METVFFMRYPKIEHPKGMQTSNWKIDFFQNNGMAQIRTAQISTDLPKDYANEKNSRFAIQSLRLDILIFYEATRGFEKLS